MISYLLASAFSLVCAIISNALESEKVILYVAEVTFKVTQGHLLMTLIDTAYATSYSWSAVCSNLVSVFFTTCLAYVNVTACDFDQSTLLRQFTYGFIF